MRSLQDEIRQTQRKLSCPVCGRTFDLRDIRVRSYLGNNSVELSVVCSRGHTPIILLVPINLKAIAQAGPITDKELRRALRKIDSLQETIQEITKEKHDRKNH
jgi:hypothetical protein